MIGEVLKNEREQQGLTLKDVEHGTSIRSAYIDAIEREDFASLPGEVYTRGFVRNYANFLRLNSEEVVIQFKIDYAAVMHPSADEIPTKSSVGRIFRKKKSTETLVQTQPEVQQKSEPEPRFETFSKKSEPILEKKSEPVVEQKVVEPVVESKPVEPEVVQTPPRFQTRPQPIKTEPIQSKSTQSQPVRPIQSPIFEQPQTETHIPIENTIPESASAAQSLIYGAIPDEVSELVAKPVSKQPEPSKPVKIVEDQIQVEINPIDPVEEEVETKSESKHEEPAVTKLPYHEVNSALPNDLPNDQIRIEVEQDSAWKKYLVAAVLLLAVGGGGYYMLNQDSQQTTSPNVASKTVEPSSNVSGATNVEKISEKDSEKDLSAPIHEEKTVEKDREKVVEKSTSKVEKSEKELSRNPITSTAQASAKTVEVKAKLTGACWLEVVADGEVVYADTAKAGQTLSWKADQKISVTAGNAGAVEFFKNGVSLGKAGEDGDVVEKNFTK